MERQTLKKIVSDLTKDIPDNELKDILEEAKKDLYKAKILNPEVDISEKAGKIIAEIFNARNEAFL